MNEFRSIIGISRFSSTHSERSGTSDVVLKKFQLETTRSNSITRQKSLNITISPKASASTKIEGGEIPSFSSNAESSNSRKRRIRRKSISTRTLRLSASSFSFDAKQQQNSSNIQSEEYNTYSINNVSENSSNNSTFMFLTCNSSSRNSNTNDDERVLALTLDSNYSNTDNDDLPVVKLCLNDSNSNLSSNNTENSTAKTNSNRNHILSPNPTPNILLSSSITHIQRKVCTPVPEQTIALPSYANKSEFTAAEEEDDDFAAAISGGLYLSLNACNSSDSLASSDGDDDGFNFIGKYDDDKVQCSDSLYGDDDGIIQCGDTLYGDDDDSTLECTGKLFDDCSNDYHACIDVDDDEVKFVDTCSFKLNPIDTENESLPALHYGSNYRSLPIMKRKLTNKSSFYSMFSSLGIASQEKIDKLIKQHFKSRYFCEMGECGKGAFAIVIKAFHLPSCKVVAIKSSLGNDKLMRNQFKKEIAILHELKNCPFIVNMIDSGFDLRSNQMKIALEFMDMSSLAKCKTTYSVDEIRCISYSILKALQALHVLLYVHNDIKPDNILINHSFEVKLSDFGCAKRMDNRQTPLTQPVGSLKYRAYEMLFVSPVEYTTKADIYSLGITLYELWNGETADDYTYYEPPIPQQNQSVVIQDKNFVEFFQLCLEKDYHCRWNAEQLLLHPFFDCYTVDNDGIKDTKWSETLHKHKIKIENANDLPFMIESLIDYYSTYVAADLIPTELTPIDNIFTDEERLQSIVEHTGLEKEEIVNCFQEAVHQKTIDILRL